MTVSTKRAERRAVKFESLDDILADAERLTRDGVRCSGNWTPGQVFWHVAYFIDHSVSGFPFKLPLHLRLLGRLLKGRALAAPPPAGLKLPASAAVYATPPDALAAEDGLAYLRRSVEAAKQPDAMRHPSPLVGRLTHAQWEQFNCRHAELHLAFLHPAADTSAKADG